MRITGLSTIFAVSLALSAASTVSAANSNAGTAAYTFLKIGTGAKSQAMGGAFVGLADDATALYYNPAGLTARGHDEMAYDELLDRPLTEDTGADPRRIYGRYLLELHA